MRPGDSRDRADYAVDGTTIVDVRFDPPEPCGFVGGNGQWLPFLPPAPKEAAS
jgi:hypothetical protein